MSEQNFKTLLPHIKLMVFDVDGVLSDGSVHCFNDGEQVRVLNIKDGIIFIESSAAVQLSTSACTVVAANNKVNPNTFINKSSSKIIKE